MQKQDLQFCAKCASSALESWRGWPHRDALPALAQLRTETCEECGARESISNDNIAWLNHHSAFSTGLPDYWLLVVTPVPNSWGLPYFAAGKCPACQQDTVVSEMRFPNGKRELKHNCQRCGIRSIG